MPTNCRNKKRSQYPFARTDRPKTAEEIGEFTPPAASVPASNGTNTSAAVPAPASAPTPAPVNPPLSTTHWIPSSSLRIAGGPHTRKRCFHPARYLPLRRHAVPCSIPQQPSPRSQVRKTRRRNRPVRQTYSWVYDFLANVHFTFPDSQRPLSTVSTLPLNAEDDQAVESDTEPLLSSEPDYCSCGESMHVHDSEDEADGVIGDEGEGPHTYESVETYTVVISTKEAKAEVVKCNNDWHIDSFLEAVGAAARDSVQQVKVEVAKGEKQRRFDAYLEAVSAAAEAENEVIEVYYCPTPPLPVPFLNARPRAHALTSYPSTPSPGRPGSFALDQPVYFVSTGRPSISAIGFPGQPAQAALQAPQAASPSPSLLASEQNYGRTNFESYDNASFESYDNASFESYASGCTTGYAADASDDESDLPSYSCFSSSRSSSPRVSISSSVPAAPPADGPQEKYMVPTWYDIAMRPTFLPHVMPSVPTTREPSPTRSGRPIGIDTYPSSHGLAVRAEQPAYVHPSLGPSVRTVYEIRNGKPDKHTRKNPKTSSERKRKRRFLNKLTRMFGGYQNADPIDEQPSRNRGRGNKIPCLDGWTAPKRAESPKRPDTPVPSVVRTGFGQGASSSSMATTATTSPSSKKSSSSSFSLFGLLKTKNKGKKKDKGKGKSTDSSPKFFSSRLWSSSSSRTPAVRSFEGPTLCRPVLDLQDLKQEAPLTAMEINALLSAMVPDKALPPVQHYDASAYIAPATPQRIFSSVPIIMAPTPRIHALGSTPTDQKCIWKAPHNNLVNYTGAGAGTNSVVMPTTPVLKPMSPPVQDVPMLTLGPFAPRFVSIEQLLDLAPDCKSEEEEEEEEEEGNAIQPDGAAQVVSMKIYYDADEDDKDDEDEDPDYWYNAYAENPNPIPIIKNKSLGRSLRSYHPGNRNSWLEPSTLPACLLADDDNNDGRHVFEDGTVLSNTPSKGKVMYRIESRSETWRSFSPGKPPLNTIQEATTDAEADDEFSALSSAEYGGSSSSSSSDDPDAIDSADKRLLEQVIRVYGQVVSFDPDMFKRGYDLPEKNMAPGIRRKVGVEHHGVDGGGRGGGGGVEEEEDSGAGVGKYNPPKTHSRRNREYQKRRERFEDKEEEIRRWAA
ncbi:hypothetical protein BGZ74_008633 [Mortierella antarctica]|nr:hypothetical protein BGZ74_008633 [Mortierella antarctica]